MKDILLFKNRKEFYDFMKINHTKFNELFLDIKIGDPNKIKDQITYLDVVEVCLCFGWIDSIKRKINGKIILKVSERKEGSYFSELNKERCKRLIKLGDMTESGLKVIPDLSSFKPPKYLMNKIMKNKKAYDFFLTTPKLYQNIRLYNLDFYYKKDRKMFKTSFENFIKNCQNHKLYGSFDDYGRLKDYESYDSNL